jgi:hypothetical protein
MPTASMERVYSGLSIAQPTAPEARSANFGVLQPG